MTRKISLKESRAKYSTLVEKVQTTGKPVIVEKEGKPAVVVISYSEYLHLAALREKERTTLDSERLFSREIAAFERMKPDLLKTHQGKWVAIVDGQLVDADKDRRILSKRMTAKFGDRTMLLERVLVQPQVYSVDSPERARV